MKNNKIFNRLIFAVLIGLISSCQKEDDNNDLKMPEPIVVENGKSCINVGMSDTLHVSIPSVEGATSYNWTATYSDHSPAHLIHSNGIEATIIVDNRTYGDSLIIDVVAKNENGYGAVRKLIIAIEGVGIDYSLSYLNIDVINYVVLESTNPPYRAAVGDVNLPDSVEFIQWYRWVGSAYIQDDGTQPKLTFTPSISPSIAAILVNANQCKSRIEYIHPK